MPDQKVPLFLPPGLASNLVYTYESHFFICAPCINCHGTGNSQDLSQSMNPTQAYADKKCKDCDGLGYKQQFMTLDQLYQAMAPAFYQHFLNQLPDILASAQMAIIESVMES